MTLATVWQAYVEDEAQLLVFDGILWKGVSSVLENLSLSMLGVHASADAVNRLAISSDASMFNNAGVGHQVKVNKQAVTDTASLLYQTNWTGFAEIELNGSNDFSVKVSSDIGQWRAGHRPGFMSMAPSARHLMPSRSYPLPEVTVPA